MQRRGRPDSLRIGIKESTKDGKSRGHGMRPSFTLGIEEEYQTIDPETRDLRSHIATEMLSQGNLRLEERVKAEMHQ